MLLVLEQRAAVNKSRGYRVGEVLQPVDVALGCAL